jgi:hypothetical protein
MINPQSRSLEWITEVAQRMGIRDKALVEKTIRAFSLLEALARSGCPFLFKGGSSLMLHLNTNTGFLPPCALEYNNRKVYQKILANFPSPRG